MAVAAVPGASFVLYTLAADFKRTVNRPFAQRTNQGTTAPSPIWLN